jgi:hypothetical protein
MENHCNAAHDLHFLLKEAAVDAYTSISRWMGEREGSLFSEENVTDQETSFHSALIHIRDVLDNLQESDPDLFWNKGQRDECLRLLNPFCRETLKLSRKVQRLAEMLGQHVRELEPALIKFGSEHQFKERDPAPPRTSKLNFFNKGTCTVYYVLNNFANLTICVCGHLGMHLLLLDSICTTYQLHASSVTLIKYINSDSQNVILKPKFEALSSGAQIIHKLLQKMWYFSIFEGEKGFI